MWPGSAPCSSEDVERSSETGAVRRLGAADLRVLPSHGVASQPPVGDDAGDDRAQAGLFDMDGCGERMPRAVEVIQRLDDRRVSRGVPRGVGEDLAGKCAIVTSYRPSPADIKGEEIGEGGTEKLRQYEIYRKMLANHFN